MRLAVNTQQHYVTYISPSFKLLRVETSEGASLAVFCVSLTPRASFAGLPGEESPTHFPN